MNIALVVTRDGMPLATRYSPGNTTDVTTVGQIVSGMELLWQKANRVWVMDRGMVSRENGRGQERRRYVIGAPGSRAAAGPTSRSKSAPTGATSAMTLK
ncbi:MAG: hypothetical protein IPI02_23340 [Sterolibacteriaceae bacterium]|nr:hypothetical protein [Sterolibacteriaceae bacterium]